MPIPIGTIHVWLHRQSDQLLPRGHYLDGVLQHYLSPALLSESLGHSDNGKPCLAPNPRQLQFNLSHSHELIGCALYRGEKIGFDLEYLPRRNRHMAIARRYFSASEVAVLERLDGEQQRLQFYRLWTLKEAVLKAEGKGLAGGLDRFAFELNPAAGQQPGIRLTPALPDSQTDTDWLFLQWQPAPDYCCALALIQPPQPGHWEVVLHSAPDQLTSLDGSSLSSSLPGNEPLVIHHQPVAL